MSKKGFTSGLDSVFSAEAQFEPNIDDSPWLLDTTAAKPKSRAKSQTRKSGKSFTSDLETLFAAASVERPREETELSHQRPRTRARRPLAVVGGLDGLIRDTTNGVAQAQQEQAAREAADARKRVTFTYDRDRFARLKTIARQEGEYLKDIISGLLNEYISSYERERSLS